MNITLSSKDFISLYTEIDETKGTVKSTRSVIVNINDNKKEVVIVDDISFYLFISIPSHIDPLELRRFMVNSYSFVHYENPFGEDGNINNNTSTKGLYNSHINNHMISDYIKLILQHIDIRNNNQFKDHIKSNQFTRKFKSFRYDYDNDDSKEEKENNDDDSSNEDDEEEEENNDITYNNINYTYEEDIVTGLEKDSSICMPFNDKDLKKRFDDEKQYKLCFKNHSILYYFLNRFMNRSIKFKDTKKMIQGNEVIINVGHEFKVKIIQYQLDSNRIRTIKPLNAIFKGKPLEYIDNQLLVFKDTTSQHGINYNFESPIKIQYGLLHPSSLESNYECRNYINTFDNMISQKKQEDKNKIAYQTLFIDISSLIMNYDIKNIYLVQYNDRKSNFTHLIIEKKKIIQQQVPFDISPYTPASIKSNNKKNKKYSSKVDSKSQKVLIDFFPSNIRTVAATNATAVADLIGNKELYDPVTIENDHIDKKRKINCIL